MRNSNLGTEAGKMYIEQSQAEMKPGVSANNRKKPFAEPEHTAGSLVLCPGSLCCLEGLRAESGCSP